MTADRSDALAAHVERFLVHCERERAMSTHTVRAYRGDLETVTTFLARRGITDTRQVDAAALRAWLVWQINSGIARSTVARRASAVRSWCAWCAKTGRLAADPSVALTVPKRSRPLPRVPTRQHLQRTLDRLGADKPADSQPSASEDAPAVSSAVQLRDLAMVELLYGAGLRVAELCALDLPDVDVTGGMVRVMGKGSKERVVPCGGSAAAAISDYVRRGRAVLLGEATHNALFLGVRGGRIGQRQVRTVTQRMLLGQTGWSVNPHALRHAAATHMLDGGADLRSVQEQLGHSSLASTQIYTQVSIDRLSVTYDRSHPRA